MWSFIMGKRGAKKKPADKVRRGRVEQAFGPPLTDEELRGNLSDLERTLNKDMKCHAGRNQVFIRSLLTGSGTTRPRIALRCHLRKDIGQSQEVFFEEIRSLCCADPTKCPAYQNFEARHVTT